MIIDCPVCGPRHLHEFVYGGDASRTPPALDADDRTVWEDYVYSRTNRRGSHLEYWQHAGGCRSWLKVSRDVTTHGIDGVELIGPFAGTESR